MRKDYVDSCVFLGFVLEKDQKCKDYINTIGYKNRNIGIISHFVISEIFIKLITMINKDKVEGNYVEDETLQYIIDIFKELLRSQNLIINKLSKSIIDIELYTNLKEIDYKLTDDDMFHLIEAIKKECHAFITIDKEIINNIKLSNHLLNYHKLQIIELK